MSPLAGRVRAVLFGVAMLTLALGCAKKHGESLFDPDTGHADGWYTDHGQRYLAAADECTGCHGGDLRGGISSVGCFVAAFDGRSCHAGGPSSFIHPEGWGRAASHGPPAIAAPGPLSGLAFCATCHGADFKGGVVNSPCSRCHGVAAPHPRAPWRGGASTHTRVNTGNAEACAQCHRRPGATGAAGCFNGTLCHTTRGVHPGGWDAADVHGATAKRAPGATTGFSSCAKCHGTGFSGDGTGVSCFPCHGVNAPHPRSPWLGRLTHTTTARENAATCSACHRNRYPPAGAAPDCFNNTLCHAHESGWASPDRHGAGAKDRPGPTRGFPACQSCHGRLFDGGIPGGSCFRATACHARPAPHPPGPWNGTRTHRTTNEGNTVACALCHRSPSAPGSLPNGCFNQSLCHGREP